MHSRPQQHSLATHSSPTAQQAKQAGRRGLAVKSLRPPRLLALLPAPPSLSYPSPAPASLPRQSPRAHGPARALRPAAAAAATAAAAAAAAAERSFAVPGFQLRAGTGSLGGGAGGGQGTENAAEPGARSRSQSLDQNLAAACTTAAARRCFSAPPPPSRPPVVRGLWVSGLKVGPDVGPSSVPGLSGRQRTPPPPRRLSLAFCSERPERRAELTVILTVI